MAATLRMQPRILKAGCGAADPIGMMRPGPLTPFRMGSLLELGLFIAFFSLAAGVAQTPKADFVGSESCKGCHAKEYNGWKQTRMANVVRDPREHPEAVLGDFQHSDPVRTFDLGQVA